MSPAYIYKVFERTLQCYYNINTSVPRIYMSPAYIIIIIVSFTSFTCLYVPLYLI